MRAPGVRRVGDVVYLTVPPASKLGRKRNGAYTVEGRETSMDQAVFKDLMSSRAMRYAWKAGRVQLGFVNTGYATLTVMIHHVMCPCPMPYVPDHVNGDRTDNRSSNLEPVTQSENVRRGRRPGLGR